MSMPSRLTRRAVKLAEAGCRQEALDLLRAVIQQDPHYEPAWRHYVYLLSTVEERSEALKAYLRIEPANRGAQEALWSLWEVERGELDEERNRLGRYLGRATVALGLAFVVLLGLVAGLVVVRQEVVDHWVGRVAALEARLDVLQDAHEHSLTDYSELQRSHNEQSLAYADLAATHGALVSAHDQLRTTHDGLLADYDTLTANHQTLQNAYETLAARFADLEQRTDSLGQRNDWLEVNALMPPYIAVEGRRVHMVFMRSDGTVDGWETPFESLERSIEMGIDKREGTIWGRDPVVNLDNPDTGETYTLWDYRAFVDPEPFEPVMTELWAEMPSDYELIHETWHIVSQLTTYSEDIGETPRFPLETFLAGGGDCEDTSILLASMIKAAPVPWKVELVYMDIDNPAAPQDVDHVIVHIDTGDKEYYIETTNHDVMEPYDDILAWHFEVEG